MSEIYLGVIAVSVFVMAAIQIAAIVFAARAVRRVDRLLDRLERDIQPIVASLQTLTKEAARATSMAAGHLERADQVMGAWLAGLKTALGIVREAKGASRPRGAGAEDDDALFIG